MEMFKKHANYTWMQDYRNVLEAHHILGCKIIERFKKHAIYLDARLWKYLRSMPYTWMQDYRNV